MRSAPAGAVCSMRAAMLTAMPRMRAFGIHAAAEQHAAGVDADAHVEAVVAVGCAAPPRRAPALVEQRQAAAHRALGVVFARLVGAEHREQAVAGVLQHLAAVRSTIAVKRASAPSITAWCPRGRGAGSARSSRRRRGTEW